MDDLYLYIHTHIPPNIGKFQSTSWQHIMSNSQKAPYTFKKAIQDDWLSLTGTSSKATLQVCHKVFNKSDCISRMFQLFYYLVYSFSERGHDICITGNTLAFNNFM